MINVSHITDCHSLPNITAVCYRKYCDVLEYNVTEMEDLDLVRVTALETHFL